MKTFVLSREGIEQKNLLSREFDEMIDYLTENTVPGREQSIMITHLETASMWATRSLRYPPYSEVEE